MRRLPCVLWKTKERRNESQQRNQQPAGKEIERERKPKLEPHTCTHRAY